MNWRICVAALIFFPICCTAKKKKKKALSSESAIVPTYLKSAKQSVLIVENRPLIYLPMMVLNAHLMLPQAEIRLFYGSANKEFCETHSTFKKLTEMGILRIQLIPKHWRDMKDVWDYADFMKRGRPLWEGHQNNPILKLQADVWLCRTAEEKLFSVMGKYDFFGHPCAGPDWKYVEFRCVVGGFTVRNTTFWKELALPRNKAYNARIGQPEDIVSSTFLHAKGGRVSDFQTGSSYIVQDFDNATDPMGLHIGTWAAYGWEDFRYRPREGYAKWYSVCPGLETFLDAMQSDMYRGKGGKGRAAEEVLKEPSPEEKRLRARAESDEWIEKLLASTAEGSKYKKRAEEL